MIVIISWMAGLHARNLGLVLGMTGFANSSARLRACESSLQQQYCKTCKLYAGGSCSRRVNWLEIVTGVQAAFGRRVRASSPLKFPIFANHIWGRHEAKQQQPQLNSANIPEATLFHALIATMAALNFLVLHASFIIKAIIWPRNYGSCLFLYPSCSITRWPQGRHSG